jgi:UDP-GlcNAc:undecaprenyl-phosphate GlcNAc-1-phosphate transferase
MGEAVLAALAMGSAMMMSLALVPASRALGARWRVLDHPGERKIHDNPMPRTGGWAVFLAFMLTVAVGYAVRPHLAGVPVLAEVASQGFRMLAEADRVAGKLAAVLGGATLAFLVGLADDVFGARLHVGWKAAGQVAAASLVVAAGVKTSFLPYEWMNVAFTIVWLVGITNAFNLLDNMDGLSAGVALVASFVLLVNAWVLGEYFISLLLLAFVGALAGFLFFNAPPASVFLGDCGSHFIGFTMASLTLLERYVSHASSSYFPILMPVLVLAVPILDTTTVVVIRYREGRPIYVGDSRHLSHQLVALGLSRRAAVLFLWATTFFLGMGALSLPHAPLTQSLLVLVQSAGFVALLLVLLFTRSAAARSAAPR